MKYIDAEKLIAEIERQQRRLTLLSFSEQVELIRDSALQNGVYVYILNVIAFLQQEQPEVDFEKELKTIRESDEWRQMQKRGTYMFEDLLTVAHHFYELGLNVRKEDAK